MKNTYTGPERREGSWHLDKKVTITLILLLLGQIGSTIWWAADLSHATKENSKATIAISNRIAEIESRERESSKLVERMVRVETMLENLQSTANRIDNAVYANPNPRPRGGRP